MATTNSARTGIPTGGSGSGTVTSVSVTSANGISGTVANSTTTPAISLQLAGDVTSTGNATTVVKINGISLAGLATGILKNTTTTGVPSIAVAADFPTLNQNTTGSAAKLTTPRAIYGNNFDGSVALAQIIASTFGGTGNGFAKFSGPTTSEKTFILPDASSTLLYSGGAGGTPSSLTLTNATGLPPAGVTGTAAILGANTFTDLQTITQASANSGIIASTGYSLTSNNATSQVNLAGTLNTTGNPVVVKVAITNTASGATSKFASFLAGASGTTELAAIKLDGQFQAGLTASNSPTYSFIGDLTTGWGYRTTSTLAAIAGGTEILRISATGTDGLSRDIGASNGGRLALGTGGNYDIFLSRSGAAVLQQGTTNAASPVAQMLQAQGSRSGTDSNVGGGNYTIASGNGTGTGTISTLILQSPVAVASGTGAQILTTGLTIKAGVAVLTSYTVSVLPAAATAGAGATAFVTDASTTLVLGLGTTVSGSGSNKVPVYSDGTNWLYG